MKASKIQLEMYRKAAEQGDAEAQCNLGELYANGTGVPQDYEQAVAWYREAAEAGNSQGQNALGVMYHNGTGVPQDYAQAVAWYRKAAEHGLALAQKNLGVMYDHGMGVSKSPVIAYALFNIAASKESDPSRRTEATNKRTKIAAELSSEALSAGQTLSRKMADPGNLLNALDAYAAANSARR